MGKKNNTNNNTNTNTNNNNNKKKNRGMWGRMGQEEGWDSERF
jgi:hypothetical protein